LRLLHDREVQPVGHSRPIVVDVRLIAATNIDLAAAGLQRRFREDLLFRLDVIRLHVKPLRERLGELIGLLNKFNAEFAEMYRQSPLEFEAGAIEALKRYHWPGNVRQLRTLVERLHVLSPGETVTAAHVLELGQLQPAPTRGFEAIERAKLEHVRRVLNDSGGSIAHAAAVFGVHRSTIYRWLRGR
jgi:DNA-binding NtrC family response regulator